MGKKLNRGQAMAESLRDPIDEHIQRTNSIILYLFSKSKRGMSLEGARKKMIAIARKIRWNKEKYFCFTFFKRWDGEKGADEFEEKLRLLEELGLLEVRRRTSKGKSLFSLTEKGLAEVKRCELTKDDIRAIDGILVKKR